MKTLALYLPNGMVGSVYFCSVANNDKGTINLSGIESSIKLAFNDARLADGASYPKIYGNKIFESSEVICKANRQQTLFIHVCPQHEEITNIYLVWYLIYGNNQK